ncbi:response regulator transcription factor [Ferrovibrio terrae]|uniref:response regulator transcription factor n=1 Tax=Ferrovibrio terrae TaxID=2594003 RepID=UPI003138080C
MDGTPVLHIDRNQLFREGLRRILDDSPFYVSFEASSFSEGASQIVAQKPGIVIIDTDGYGEVLPELMLCARSVAVPPRVVVLTNAVAIPRLASALGAGVDGYLLKDMSAEALKQSLRLVMMGEKVFPTDLADLLINNRFVTQNGGQTERNSTLSERETEILACLVNGHSNKAIANRLQITEGTVKVHLKGVLKKIHAQNRTQAAIWALQHGIVADVTAAPEVAHT